MPRSEPVLKLTDLLKGAAQDLRQAAATPNLFTYVPHPKQLKFHSSTLREKLFIGGNRSGKTEANVKECVWWLTKTHPHRPDVNAIEEPIRGRFVGVSFLDGMDKIAIPKFKATVPKSFLIDGLWEKSWDSYRKVLTLNNGSFLEFMSYEQDLEKFAGTSRHFIAYDEEPPQANFIECRMRIIDTEGSWWISMTPVEGMSWIFDMIYEPFTLGRRPQTLVIEIRSDDNPYLKSSEIDLALEGLSDEDKAARREGRFIELGGKVYPTFSKTIHKTYNFKLDPSMTVYTSFDHGWRHPAAWLWHAVEKNGHITTFHEIIVSEHTIAELAEMVKTYEREVLEPLGISVVMRPADPATQQHSGINGMSIVQTYALHEIFLATEGIPRTMDVGIDKIQQYLKIDPDPANPRPFWQYTNDCVILERQMERLRWEKYTSKKLEYDKAPKNKVVDKDDDGPDSLRYLMTLMPDLYIPKTNAKREPITDAGPNFQAVQYASPWNTKSGMFGEIPQLPEHEKDYTVYEGSIIYQMENF